MARLAISTNNIHVLESDDMAIGNNIIGNSAYVWKYGGDLTLDFSFRSTRKSDFDDLVPINDHTFQSPSFISFNQTCFQALIYQPKQTMYWRLRVSMAKTLSIDFYPHSDKKKSIIILENRPNISIETSGEMLTCHTHIKMSQWYTSKSEPIIEMSAVLDIRQLGSSNWTCKQSTISNSLE